MVHPKGQYFREVTVLFNCADHRSEYRYIDMIENRLHRMEALLGGLLHSEDPRAQALLEE